VVIDMVGSQASAWQIDPGLPAADVLDRYRHEAFLADAVIAASSQMPPWPGGPSPGVSGSSTIFVVLLHVITETACHAGHLDAARELIDGQQWLVNT
jgi:hypothetical protein